MDKPEASSSTSQPAPSDTKLNSHVELQEKPKSMAVQPRTPPRFLGLAWELRDHIWNDAVRDDRPGIHFFAVKMRKFTWILDIFGCDTVTNCEHACEIFGLQSTSAPANGWTPWGYPPQSIVYSAPRCEKSTPPPKSGLGTDSRHSWTEGNLSAYLIDGGLWTACTHSYEVMRRYYRTRRYNYNHMYHSLPASPGAPPDRTGCFLNKEGEPQYFTVCREPQDLVCLQLNVPNELGRHLYYGAYFGLDDGNSYNRPGYKYIKHLALEFDPFWSSGGAPPEAPPDESGPEDLFKPDVLLEIKEIVRDLYLIDYRIKRRPGTSSAQEPSRNDRPEFRGAFDGNGCRFVEVRCTDTEWQMDDGSPLSSTELETSYGTFYQLHKSSVFRFVRLLERASWIGNRNHALRCNDAALSCHSWTDED